MTGGLTALVLVIGLAACSRVPTPSPGEHSLRYVALGDSYTIGTSVTAAESWPSQLVARVHELQLVANLSVNGYTSGDVIDDELPELVALQPEFVSLLIGVNYVVQGVPQAVYAANVEVILDALLEVVAANRVLCVATPDYTVTAQGAASARRHSSGRGLSASTTSFGTPASREGCGSLPRPSRSPRMRRQIRRSSPATACILRVPSTRCG